MSEKRKKIVPSAEAKAPTNDDGDKMAAQPSTAENNAMAIQGKQPEAVSTQGEPEKRAVSIVPIIQGISKEKAKLAESMGIPITGLMEWAYVMEETVKAQNKALHDLGVNIQPVVELAKAIKEKQGQQGQTTEKKNSGLGDIVGLIKEAAGQGGGGLSEGDKYFLELGRETAGLSNFFTKEMFKSMMPKAFQEFQDKQKVQEKK